MPHDAAWRTAERGRLLTFGRDCAHPRGGAAWLDEQGRPDLTRPLATWITARMLHVYALGVIEGHPGAEDVAGSALAGLSGALHDDVHGGWVPELDADGAPAEGKSCYDHAFVALASATAVSAGLDGADELQREAESRFESFWVEDDGLVVDAFSSDWSVADDYRGLNAEMHAVEAMLATCDLTGDERWRERATRGARFVAELARSHDGRLPEHFTSDWTPRPELNADRPDDPFKPYGATVGHALEWSRLILQVEGGRAGEEWALAAARLLYGRAVADGWDVAGAPGFVYTTDWQGRPVVRTRMHWVVAEAISAASVLHRRTGEARYADDLERWWRYAESHLIDPGGSWHHELDPSNTPASTVWPGSPDLYHAVSATVVPDLPIGSGTAAGLLRVVGR